MEARVDGAAGVSDHFIVTMVDHQGFLTQPRQKYRHECCIVDDGGDNDDE
jgi:hypothetical protein